MHKRPTLFEAKAFLQQHSPETMEEYYELRIAW